MRDFRIRRSCKETGQISDSSGRCRQADDETPCQPAQPIPQLWVTSNDFRDDASINLVSFPTADFVRPSMQNSSALTNKASAGSRAIFVICRSQVHDSTGKSYPVTRAVFSPRPPRTGESTSSHVLSVDRKSTRAKPQQPED